MTEVIEQPRGLDVDAPEELDGPALTDAELAEAIEAQAATKIEATFARMLAECGRKYCGESFADQFQDILERAEQVLSAAANDGLWESLTVEQARRAEVA